MPRAGAKKTLLVDQGDLAGATWRAPLCVLQAHPRGPAIPETYEFGHGAKIAKRAGGTAARRAAYHLAHAVLSAPQRPTTAQMDDPRGSVLV